jgi:hypothetical protein
MSTRGNVNTSFPIVNTFCMADALAHNSSVNEDCMRHIARQSKQEQDQTT